MRLRKSPDKFPTPPGNRTTGQMARFSVFQKEKPDPEMGSG
jgi:hypothetical protein